MEEPTDPPKFQDPEFRDANQAYFDAAARMLNHEQATRWFGEFCNYVLAVDHVNDLDKMAGVEKEALVQRFFDWEQNSFWQAAKQQLLPVCFSAYISWVEGTKSGIRSAENSVYFIVPVAAAWLLHGRKHVEEHSANLMQALLDLQTADK